MNPSVADEDDNNKEWWKPDGPEEGIPGKDWWVVGAADSNNDGGELLDFDESCEFDVDELSSPFYLEGMKLDGSCNINPSFTSCLQRPAVPGYNHSNNEASETPTTKADAMSDDVVVDRCANVTARHAPGDKDEEGRSSKGDAPKNGSNKERRRKETKEGNVARHQHDLLPPSTAQQTKTFLAGNDKAPAGAANIHQAESRSKRDQAKITSRPKLLFPQRIKRTTSKPRDNAYMSGEMKVVSPEAALIMPPELTNCDQNHTLVTAKDASLDQDDVAQHKDDLLPPRPAQQIRATSSSSKAPGAAKISREDTRLRRDQTKIMCPPKIMRPPQLIRRTTSKARDDAHMSGEMKVVSPGAALIMPPEPTNYDQNHEILTTKDKSLDQLDYVAQHKHDLLPPRTGQQIRTSSSGSKAPGGAIFGREGTRSRREQTKKALSCPKISCPPQGIKRTTSKPRDDANMSDEVKVVTPGAVLVMPGPGTEILTAKDAVMDQLEHPKLRRTQTAPQGAKERLGSSRRDRDLRSSNSSEVGGSLLRSSSRSKSTWPSESESAPGEATSLSVHHNNAQPHHGDVGDDHEINIPAVRSTTYDGSRRPCPLSNDIEDAPVTSMSPPHPRDPYNIDPLNVSPHTIPQAELVSDRDSKKKRRKRLTAIICGMALAIVVVVILVVTLTSNKSSDSAAEVASPEIAFAPEDICYDRVPGQGRGLICSNYATSVQGGGVANLVAFSRLTQVQAAEISLLNAGEVRTDIWSGTFTEEDLDNLLPFENELLVVEMTGEQIYQVLEEALDYILESNKTGAYPYAAGLRFRVDYRNDFPTRCSNVEVNKENSHDRVEEDVWEPINSTQFYRVLTNSYLAGGGDGYLQLTLAHKINVQEVFVSSQAAFENFAIQQTVGTRASGLLDPPRSRYSTQSFHPGQYDFTQL